VTLAGKDTGKSPVSFQNVPPGRYPVRVELSGYETVEQQVDVRENQSTDLGTIALKPIRPSETAVPPSGPQIIPNATYTGTIHEFGRSGYSVPLAITLASDLKSGTMTQSARSGNIVVKFTGVWESTTLRAVTNEIVSKPSGVTWEPEAFTLQFSADGKSAAYNCDADGKTYFTDLTAEILGSTIVAKLSPIYKGTITGGTPLTISFSDDRKSGTMTQTAKSGDVVVKFAGVWDGSILRAVTNEVVSKPTKVKWDPESFTLEFSEDGQSGSYKCSADGKFYTAQLSPQ